jgi:hypothetical protein
MAKLLLFGLLFLSCNSVENNIYQLEKKEKVEFLIGDEKVEIKDNYKIFFLAGQDSILPSIKGDSLIYNKFGDKTDLLTIGFKFENYSITIDRIPSYLLFQKQDCTFQFGLTSNSRFGSASNFHKGGKYRFEYLSINPWDSGIARYFERPYVDVLANK